jgi:hypothetical protein
VRSTRDLGRAPDAPPQRFGIRTLRDQTAESLSRLPSSTQAPAAPPLRGPSPLGQRRVTEPLLDAAAALLAEVRLAGPAGVDLRDERDHQRRVTRPLAMLDLDRAGYLEPADPDAPWTIRARARR